MFLNLTLPKQYEFLDRFFRLTIVNLLSSIMVPLANIINVIFLGHLAEIQYLTGVALAGEVLGLIYYLFISLRMSVTALTAIAVGQDDQEAMVLVGLRHGLMALVLGVALVVLQYPLGKLCFALVSAAPETLACAIAYFNAQIWAAPATLLNFVLIGWFIGREHVNKVLFLSFVGNAVNIALNYLFIVQWNWGSNGAGISYAISQYLTLLIGVIFACVDIKWQEVKVVTAKVWDLVEIRSIFRLNTDLFINNISLLLVFVIFNYKSVGMGTNIYAANTLLLQVQTLSLCVAEALRLSVETLGGQFEGKGEERQLARLVGTGVGASLIVGLVTASVFILLPHTVFGLFTNHTEVIDYIDIYLPWTLLILVLASVLYIIGGYFIVLKEADTLRDASLMGALLGFTPTAVAFFWVHSNHVLWLALSLFFIVRILILVPKTMLKLSNGSSPVLAKLTND
jgi:MATE family multidrug resistance protein